MGRLTNRLLYQLSYLGMHSILNGRETSAKPGNAYRRSNKTTSPALKDSAQPGRRRKLALSAHEPGGPPKGMKIGADCYDVAGVR